MKIFKLVKRMPDLQCKGSYISKQHTEFTFLMSISSSDEQTSIKRNLCNDGLKNWKEQTLDTHGGQSFVQRHVTKSGSNRRHHN